MPLYLTEGPKQDSVISSQEGGPSTTFKHVSKHSAVLIFLSFVATKRHPYFLPAMTTCDLQQ